MMKIYRIIDNTNGNIYIGKTTQKYLCQRLASHVKDYRRNNPISSSKIIKNGDYKIELIEETDDETRERYWIENSECVNQLIPNRVAGEKKQYNTQWNIDNKPYFKQYSQFRNTWGGDPRYNNNLLKIDTDVFTF